MMPRSALGFAAGALASFAAVRGAGADTAEWGVRGLIGVRSAAVQLGAGLEPTRAPAVGGAAELSYGVSFCSALTLQIGAEALGEVRAFVAGDRQDDGRRALVGHATRAGGVVGWLFTPSDALTPWFHLQLGVARDAITARSYQLQTLEGDRRVPPRLPNSVRLSPLVRASVGLQWRYADQSAWALAVDTQWVEAAEVGFSVSWATFGYL
jgi:hypothetical protein